MTALPSKALRLLPRSEMLSLPSPSSAPSRPPYVPANAAGVGTVGAQRSFTDSEVEVRVIGWGSEGGKGAERKSVEEEEHVKWSQFLSLSEVYPRSDWFQQLSSMDISIGNSDSALTLYPQYFKHHVALMSHILEGPGTLPCSWRYYLAFMSSAAHKSASLMQFSESHCLSFGGSKLWFTTPLSLPAKLRSIGSLNIKLAHRPWEVKAEDLKSLLKLWSLVDLAEAIVILIQFHGLGTFCEGLGIQSEWEMEDSKLEGARKTAQNLLNYQAKVSSFPEEITEESNEEQDIDDRFDVLAGGHLKYLPITNSARTFYASDFNWKDNGYEQVERLLPFTASLLNDTIQCAFHMTNNSIGPVLQVNTSPLRLAVWKYTQKLYGLDYDDYDYREVSLLLTKSTKSFLKKAACRPQLLTPLDFAQVDLGLSAKELVHLLLLVMEARKEGELIYWLHAFADLA